MSTKTRNLQLFMRALSASSQDGDLPKSVAAEMARMRNDEPRGGHSGLHAAVAQEPADE